MKSKKDKNNIWNGYGPELPSQRGRKVLITGANSGLGLRLSSFFASQGAEVLMACRDAGRTEQAMALIRAKHAEADLHFLELDLSDLDTLRRCADRVKEQFDKLDLLILNAGVMIPPFSRTRQGFELQFGTNHLGHFHLTGLLLPCLAEIPGSRVVTVSSIAAELNYMDFNDLNYEHKKYRKWQAYGQSKLANQMFMKELSVKLAKSCAKTISVAAHPGVSSTHLFNHSSSFLRKAVLPLIAQSPDKAALSILHAACVPGIESGSYWGPSGPFGFAGLPAQAKLQPKALDPKMTGKLWEESERLTGIRYELDGSFFVGQ